MATVFPISEKIKQVPDSHYKSDDNKWADYIEMLCLFNESQMLTLDELLDRIQDTTDGKPENVLGKRAKAIRSPIPEDPMDIGSDHAATQDEAKSILSEKFNFLEARAAIFGDFYPFEVTGNDTLSLIKTKSNKRKVYLILLISSNLDYAQEVMHPLTSRFEGFSLEVLKSLMAPNATVQYFGTGGGFASPFSGNLWNRIKQLAGFLKLHLTAECTEENIGLRNQGDSGLDLVAWDDMRDEQSNFPIFFAQCGCGKNWVDKQVEPSSFNWSSFLQLKNEPVAMMIIPHSYRSIDASWFNPLKIKKVVLLDRLRLLNSLSAKRIGKLVKDYREIMDSILSQRVDPFG
jgi:hypothetical protein